MRHERIRICDRLLVALRVPAGQGRRVAAMAHALRLRGRPVAEERLHVTLAILDDEPALRPGTVEAMRAAAGRVDVPTFEAVFDHLVSNGTTTCLLPSRGSTALAALGAALRREVARAGLAMRRGWRFRPHVTLRYDGGQHFTRAVAPIAWRAESIVLIHSHVGLTRHDILCEWPLRDEPLLF